jgi:glycerol-3-phosphate dehydrogenase subunit C
MKSKSPEDMARAVIAACADCGVCRSMLADDCLLFAELYRLYDREVDTGVKPSSAELQAMLARCTYCALCGCPDIRADIIEAKSRFAARDGLPLAVRLLQDVARLGKWCARAPQLCRRLLQSAPAAGLVKRLAAVHADRRLPVIPAEDFTSWARRQGLDRKPPSGGSKPVAYFAGCSGRYFFPDVARALVRVLQAAGVTVHVPEQVCCGMPPFLEGDRLSALKMVDANLKRLAALVAEGFDIVCSCPTCGFVLKKLIRERAYYSEAYQQMVGAAPETLKIPLADARTAAGAPIFNILRKSIYGRILQDDGYFASLDPLDRIAVAANTYDAGEYLARSIRAGDGLAPAAGRLAQHLTYFVPCHQREQGIGRPYLDLLQQIPGLTVDVVDGAYDCCGMGGIMGFKRDFHEHSLALGAPVMAKIRALNPDTVVTDCLSCRLQLTQTTPFVVRHPLEILAAVWG